MKYSITKKHNLISIVIRKIAYEKVFTLLNLLEVKKLSVFIDNGKSYDFNAIITTNQFVEYLDNLNESMLIFDGETYKCLIDRELDILTNKKILIEFDKGENVTHILVNTNNADFVVNDIKIHLNKID